MDEGREEADVTSSGNLQNDISFLSQRFNGLTEMTSETADSLIGLRMEILGEVRRVVLKLRGGVVDINILDPAHLRSEKC